MSPGNDHDDGDDHDDGKEHEGGDGADGVHVNKPWGGGERGFLLGTEILPDRALRDSPVKKH